MIPMLMIVHVSPRGGPRLRFWLPLFLLWLLLAPLAVLLSPIAAAVCLARGINPVTALAGACGVLGSATGLCVDVESPGASVLVRVI